MPFLPQGATQSGFQPPAPRKARSQTWTTAQKLGKRTPFLCAATNSSAHPSEMLEDQKRSELRVARTCRCSRARASRGPCSRCGRRWYRASATTQWPTSAVRTLHASPSRTLGCERPDSRGLRQENARPDTDTNARALVSMTQPALPARGHVSWALKTGKTFTASSAATRSGGKSSGLRAASAAVEFAGPQT